MAGAGAVRAGKAYVELFTYDSKFYSGIKRAEDRLKAFGQRTSEIGRSMMGASAAVLTPAVAATKVFADFDDQMRMAAAKTTDITNEQLIMLTDTAERLGREMSYTASDVASGMVQLAQSGFNADQINKMIEPVMNLAKATGTDIAQAADIAAGTMKSFHLEAEDMTHICDVLTATANGSAQTLTDVGEAIKYAGSAGALTGNSLEDIAAMLGVMANANIKGSMGGNALSTIITRMAMPKVQQGYENLGVSVTDKKTGEIRKFTDVMIDLQKAIGKTPSSEKLKALTDLFGLRGMKGGANIVTGDWNGLAKAIENADGKAAQTAKMMEDGLGGSMRRLKSAVEGVAIQIGKSLSPEIQKLSEYLTENARKIAEWVTQNKDTIFSVAKLAFEVGAAGTALVGLGGTIKGLAFGLGAFGDLVAGIATSFGLIAGAPVEAAIIAIGVAAGGAMIKMESLNKSAEKIIEEHKKESEQDNALLARLKELADKTDLSNQEMLEAAQIVDNLNGKYKELGLSIDPLTGKIEGLADAQAKMNAQQLRLRTIDERKKLEDLQKELRGYGTQWLTSMGQGREYTLSELQDMDKRGIKLHSEGAGADVVSDEKLGSNIERAVYNPLTKKYRIAGQRAGVLGIGEESAVDARNRLEKELGEFNNLIEDIRITKENIKDLNALTGNKDAGYAALEAARNGEELPQATQAAEQGGEKVAESAENFFAAVEDTLEDKAQQMTAAQNGEAGNDRAVLQQKISSFGAALRAKVQAAQDMVKNIEQQQNEQAAQQAMPLLHGAAIAQLDTPAQEVIKRSTRSAKTAENWNKVVNATQSTASTLQKHTSILTEIRDTLKNPMDVL